MAENNIILIAGGTGGIGKTLVGYFLEKGAVVIVPSRKSENLEALKKFIGEENSARLETHLCHLGKMEDAERLVNTIVEKHEKLDAFINCIGKWWQGKFLYEMEEDEWQSVMESNLNIHFKCIKYFVPVIRRGGSYFTTNNFSSDAPREKSAAMSIAGAGKRAMTIALSKELVSQKINVFEVVMGIVNLRLFISRGGLPFLQKVGDYMLNLLQSGSSNTVHYLMPKPEDTKAENHNDKISENNAAEELVDGEEAVDTEESREEESLLSDGAAAKFT